MTATPTPRPALLAELARRFERFAALDGRDDPLYTALAATIATRPALLELLAQAPQTQQLPVLLLAALHERVLAGADHGLAAYYPSVGGTRAPDAALASRLEHFVAQEHEALQATLRSRNTQTNEIGRCAVLWPALQALSRRLAPQREALPPRHPLALFDFGCSAGLNLGVAQYRYVFEGQPALGSSEPLAPQVPSRWRGAPPQALLGPCRWQLAQRLGVDLAPIDPRDPAAARWLQACVWPGDVARHQRLAQALALARQDPPVLQASEQGLAVLAAWLDQLPPGVQPVLFHSWVLAYLDGPALQAHQAQARALVAQRGLAWISAEAAARSPLQHQPPLPAGESAGSATLWSLHWRDAQGQPREQALAWSHPHGRWVQWLAQQDGGEGGWG